MNRNDDFETIWTEFLEGRFEKLSQDELDRLLDADEATFNSHISNYQVHRLLKLRAKEEDKLASLAARDFTEKTMRRLTTEYPDSRLYRQTPISADERAESPKFPVKGVLKYRTRSVVLASVVAAVVLILFRVPSWLLDGAGDFARVVQVEGVVRWTDQSGIMRSVSQGQAFDGGTLETQSMDAWVELVCKDGTRLTFSGPSLVTMSDRGQKILHMRYGRFSANVRPQPKQAPMLVYTPAASLRVVGTRFDVDAQEEDTRLVVNQGEVQFKRNIDGQEVGVTAAEEIFASMDRTSVLEPRERRDAERVWTSNLYTDVVRGKWMTKNAKLGRRLKELVRVGQMSETDAIKEYKAKVSLDDSDGSVWALPTALGLLVHLRVDSLDTRVRISPESRLNVCGRFYGEGPIEVGLTVYNVEGGFAGKIYKEIDVDEFQSDDGNFEVSLSVADLVGESKVPDFNGHLELRDCWCSASDFDSKLEINSVELLRGERSP